MTSVTRTVLMPSGKCEKEAVTFLPGQFVIVGTQLMAVCIEVACTVRVVRASPTDWVCEGMSVFPVMPPVAAIDRMLEETDSAAVTGQMVVESSIVSVTKVVDTPSGKFVGTAVLAGQFAIVAAQLTTVWTDVVTTVRVVKGSVLSETTTLELWNIVNAELLLLFVSKASPVAVGAGRVEMLIVTLLTVDGSDELL